MSERAIIAWEFVVATAAAVVLGTVVSMGAVYGLNRFFDAYDQAAGALAVYPQGAED